MSIQRLAIPASNADDFDTAVWLISHALWSFEVTPQAFSAVVLSLRAAKIITLEQGEQADELLETLLESFDDTDSEDENVETK